MNQYVNDAVVFTLQSIKSRIETTSLQLALIKSFPFLLYSPLNQGLKPPGRFVRQSNALCFYSTVH